MKQITLFSQILKFSLTTSFMVTAAFVIAPSSAHAAIFGNDNRISVTPGSPQNTLARATAVALINSSRIQNADGTFDLITQPLTSSANLCGDERFAAQQSLDNYPCTGFLVAPDLLVTAGHCVSAVNNPNEEIRNRKPKGTKNAGNACDVWSWLFDFQAGPNGQAVVKRISKEREYRCKEIIYAIQNQQAPWNDYALIRLDRAVKGRVPLKLNTKPIPRNEQLSVLGYPFGSPVKYANFGRVLVNNPARQSFLSSVDAIEGNSGGPVLNAQNEVVGILVGGSPMFNTFEDTARGCERVNRCDEIGRSCKLSDSQQTLNKLKLQGYQGVGSEVQRIKPVVDLLKKIGVVH